MIHNHPSGDPTPSRQDILTTKRMKEAGEFLGIPLCDHIIIGDQTYLSFRRTHDAEEQNMKTAQLGIELGTRHLRICTRDKEEFLKIKNMIAFDEDAETKSIWQRSICDV